MKKIIFLILGILLMGVVFFFAAKNWLLKVTMEQSVSRITGFKTSVSSLKYDFPSTILIQELEILNPSEFLENVFVKIPEVYISFNFFRFLKGKGIHFPEMRLHIQEIHIEKNSEGVSNVELLSALGGSGESDQPEPSSSSKPPASFLLDKFEFSLREVSYQDSSGIYGASGLPNKLSVDMDIQQRIYTDIHDPQVLVKLILAEILRQQTFGRLLNLNPKEIFGEDLYDVVLSGQAFIGERASVLTGQAGAAVQNLVTETQGLLTDTMGNVQDVSSGLFGKLKTIVTQDITTAKTQ